MKATVKAQKQSKINGKAKPVDSSDDSSSEESSSEEMPTKKISKMKKAVPKAVNKRKADDSSDEEPLPKPTPKKSKKKQESSSEDSSSDEEPKPKIAAKSPGKTTPAKAVAKKKKESSSEEDSSSDEEPKAKPKAAAKSPAKAVVKKKKETSSEEESSSDEEPKAKAKPAAKANSKAVSKKKESSSEEESSSDEEEKPKQKAAAKRKAESSSEDEESNEEEEAPKKKTKKPQNEEEMDEDDSSDDVSKFKVNGVSAEPKKELDYVLCFNVPEGTASTKLENFLSKRAGEIGSIQMIQGAVIGVEKGSADEFAETLSGMEFSQQSLIAVVPPCQETAEKIATSSTCVATGASGGGSGYGNRSFSSGGFDRSGGGGGSSKTLMVTGLPEDVNYGMIKKSIPGGVQYDIKGRDDRKCCFVQYETTEEAAEVLQSCKGCNVGSSRVYIKFATERGGGRGGGRGGRGGGDFGGGNRRSFQGGDPSVAYSPCMAVFNLPFSASEEEVKGHFDNVEKYVVPKSGMAIIKFGSVEDCQTALTNIGDISIQGRQLRGEARDEAAAEISSGGFGGGGRGGFRGGRGGRGRGGGFGGGRGGRGGFRGGRGGGAAPAGKKTNFDSDSD